MPQAPQLAGLLRLASQPSAGLLLQSANPALQEAILHDPVVHEGVAWLVEQALPQAPQLVGLVRLASQPSMGLLLQSANPAPQEAILHDPFVHDGVALLVEQALPQAPQLVGLLRLASQPSAGLLLQSANPLAQEAILHDPFTHDGVALLVEQALPQAPQFFGSVLGFAQVLPEHKMLGGMQAAGPQTPLLQMPLRQLVFWLHFCPFWAAMGQPRTPQPGTCAFICRRSP